MDGDYNLRGYDLATYYAQFTRRAMPPAAIRALSYADTVCKETHGEWHIGYACWMALVCAPRDALARIAAWALGQAEALARERMPGRKRKRFCESYSTRWGRVAADDGVSRFLYGKEAVPSVASRALEFGVSRAPYASIKRLIYTMLVIMAADFEFELRTAIDLRMTGYIPAVL